MITATWRRAILTAAGILFCFASSARSQEWARAMFDRTTCDFGTVARGAKVEHRFVVENIYQEDARIASVSSSCGCTALQISKRDLKTWEKAEIVAELDTRGFSGRKDSTITVLFDRPFAAEVQLHVHAYIRSDIVVQPGAIQFGSVSQGTAAKQDVVVTYAGRDDWRIAKVECANPHIEARAVETGRTPGQASYSLSVKLKENAPAGYIRDQLVLVTNDLDGWAARVPVSVEGVIVPALTIRPSPLSMGAAEAGQPLTKNLVIQGKTPFRIVAVYSSDDRFQCKVSGDAKTVHVLPVTFSAKDGSPAGNAVSAKLRIETDLSGVKTAEVAVSVQLTPAGTTKPPQPPGQPPPDR